MTSPHELILPTFLIFDDSARYEMYLTEILIYISLVTRDVEHFFMCILAIYLSLSVKCLFKSGAYFLKLSFIVDMSEFSCQVRCQSCERQLGWRSKMDSSQAGSWCWACIRSSAGAVRGIGLGLGLPPCSLSSIAAVFLQSNHPPANQAEATWPFLMKFGSN